MNLPSLQSAYAIILDFDKTNLSLPYDEALSNIRNVMVQFQFKPLTNNVYVCTSSKNQLALLYMLVQELSKITWLKPSLVTLKAFKMDNISDFTDIIKGIQNLIDFFSSLLGLCRVRDDLCVRSRL